MGRWAQRRIRGGGGQPTVSPLANLRVLANGTTKIVLAFIEAQQPLDDPTLFQLNVNGATATNAGVLDDTNLIMYASELINPGDPWSIGDTAWLFNPYFPPTSGLCVAGPLQDVQVDGVVHEDATHLRIVFTDAILAISGATADPAFSFNGVPVTNVTQAGSNDVVVAVAAAAAKTDWQVTAQPAWLRNGLAAFSSGAII